MNPAEVCPTCGRLTPKAERALRSQRAKDGLARRAAEGKPTRRRGPDARPRRTEGYVAAWARRRAESDGDAPDEATQP